MMLGDPAACKYAVALMSDSVLTRGFTRVGFYPYNYPSSARIEFKTYVPPTGAAPTESFLNLPRKSLI